MGCSQSKAADRTVDSAEDLNLVLGKTQRVHRNLITVPVVKDDDSIIDGKLSERCIRKRIEVLPTRNLVIPNGYSNSDALTIRYSITSQRGFYPDDQNKPNQDSYSTSKSFGGLPHDLFLGIYDGHGTEGHDCAQFTKKKLPELMGNQIRAARFKVEKDLKAKTSDKAKWDPLNWPLLNEEQIQACSRKAHLACNESMHENASVADKLSGTTSITALLHNNLLTISNVGDSRAVLGKVKKNAIGEAEEEKQPEVEECIEQAIADTINRKVLEAIPLSHDQTPYRSDELQRIKKAGARVLSIDQLEGKEPEHENWQNLDLGVDIDVKGDPPRVWVPDGQYPGCAFTRSLGDQVGEGIGIIATPEVTCFNLVKGEDAMLVLGSDGVFEFLTNQEVVDICSQFDDPADAARAVVRASYDQWLIHENRTDDITVAVVFLGDS